MDDSLSQDDVVNALWSAYKKTPQYSQGLTKAIPAHNSLVEKQESMGLTSIYVSLIKRLNSSRNAKDELRGRRVSEWLAEWKQMHRMLFAWVLKDRGKWRRKNVRFGYPGEEDLYHIPDWQDVPREIGSLAMLVNELISTDYANNEEKYSVLAQIHYQFIRIHPFGDGNGRIARAVTDQLSIFFGFPPAMAGYPRHDNKKREYYHRAIRSCVDDPGCSELARWIAGYIEQQLQILA